MLKRPTERSCAGRDGLWQRMVSARSRRTLGDCWEGGRVFAVAMVLSWIAACSWTASSYGAEYFVSKQGADTNVGTSRDAAFASVQRGVDALQPGDTLTIAPGEYFEAVKRTDLGNLERETVIRAEIPGTVTLRGDVPAPKFQKLAGHRFVYVADFPFAGAIPAVNEIDSLTILKRMPNSTEVDFVPGTFFHDAKSGKLYVSTSDMRPIENHHYSVSVVPTTGLLLVRPRRVTIDGLAITGFSAMELIHYREETAGGVWGLYLVHGKNCVVRNCRAYLNAWGIGMQSGPPGCGDNVIERCSAWGNKSPFANGDMGGISVFAARRDTVRDCTTYLNGMYGVNIYGTGGAPPNYADDGGNEPKNKSVLERNLVWGNETADIKIKTGYEYFHEARHCVAPGLWSVTNIVNGTMGRATTAATTKLQTTNHILFSETPNLDPRAEFADPDHHDYRLQATSQFRGTGANGADRGALPFSPNVFFVRPDGDDAADGMSIAHAWKTLGHAARQLKPGAMLFLEPGEYHDAVTWQVHGDAAAPIQVRGRGIEPVILRGEVRLNDCRHFQMTRLTFRDEAKIENSQDITFEHCHFVDADKSLQATGARGLTLAHNAFVLFREAAVSLTDCSAVDLRGNLFNNMWGPVLRLTNSNQLRYSNYNSYRNAANAWYVNGERRSVAEFSKQYDKQSRELTPVFEVTDHAVILKNAEDFAAAGPFGKPVGPYRDGPRRKELRLVVKPTVFSTSATTANLEWVTSLPATCQLAWGTTPACESRLSFNVNCFGTYSLTGLQPGQKYFFRIRSLETPRDILPKTEPQHVTLDDEPITFTTLTADAAPTTFYVAPDGDDAESGRNRQRAWRSIGHAAQNVRVGDTVLIAGGKYRERIRLRVTGETGRPISFRAMPGERVELNGHDMTLNSGFVAGGKSHLRFDGFYFSQFNLFPNDSWSLLNSGEFQLYMGRDIQITRCFSEGRGGYSASPVAAFFVEDLLIKNCVNTYKFGGMYFWRCPNLMIENTVFAEPMIMAFVLRNEKQQRATMKNCIFTDMLDKKARLNLGVLCCDGEIDGFRNPSNCYFLRDVIPLEQRVLQGNQTISQLGQYVTDPIFGDPQFAGDPGAKGNPQDKSGFSPDRMMDSSLPLDFDSFYATNPELMKRDIGLQRDAFHDFHFQKRP